jgi:hypothetical protein
MTWSTTFKHVIRRSQRHIGMDSKVIVDQIGPTFEEVVLGIPTEFSSPFGEDATHIPTPHTSPYASSLEEDDAFKIPSMQILSLEKIIDEFEKYLEKERTLAKVAKVVNKLRAMLDKDQRGLKFL